MSDTNKPVVMFASIGDRDDILEEIQDKRVEALKKISGNIRSTVLMSYKKIIDNIRSKKYIRSELMQMRANVEIKCQSGDKDALIVLDEIDRAEPLDDFVVFMGFCPSASMENRLDMDWKKQGVCTFDFLESEHQLKRFNSIWPGDLIILKKRQVFGETMQLYGHGRVSSIQHNLNGKRHLIMNWSTQEEIIEVPLMACNSTVDIKQIAQVKDVMPDSFFEWLK
jgi:hypothetical protein